MDKIEWVLCKDRLPSERGTYLVTYYRCYWNDISDETCVGTDSFMGKTSWSKRKTQHVIAWAKMPEPYRENEEIR